MADEVIPLPGWRGGDGDAAYLDKTLRHTAMEVSLDESITWRAMFSIWFRAALIAWAFLFFFLFIGLLASGGSVFTQFVEPGAGGAGPALAMVGFFGCPIVFWVIFLFSKRDDPVGEWRVLLADRAPAAGSVYSHIVGRLRDRRMPIAAYTRRSPSGFGTVSNRLVLVDGYYQVYVSVFEYGTSLYLGWMMWRSRRGVVLLARFVQDTLTGMIGGLDAVNLMLRTERPRAMREAVHAVCREGLHVAVERIEVPISYGFPQGLPPIEQLPVDGAGFAGPQQQFAAPQPFPPQPQPPVPQ